MARRLHLLSIMVGLVTLGGSELRSVFFLLTLNPKALNPKPEGGFRV